MHHSPRFEVVAKTGTFRLESDPGPWSAALREQTAGTALAAGAPPPPPPPPATKPESDAASLQSLMERFRKDMGKTAAGVIPVQVSVPDIGPSFFVAAELTAESQSPLLELQYKRTSRF